MEFSISALFLCQMSRTTRAWPCGSQKKSSSHSEENDEAGERQNDVSSRCNPRPIRGRGDRAWSLEEASYKNQLIFASLFFTG